MKVVIVPLISIEITGNCITKGFYSRTLEWINVFDWVGTLVAIFFLCIMLSVVFYPTFKELVNKFWERIDRIKRKLEEETEEAW